MACPPNQLQILRDDQFVYIANASEWSDLLIGVAIEQRHPNT